MLKSEDYQTMKFAVEVHGDDFWEDKQEESSIFLLEDVEVALDKEGYELVLQKKE